MDRYLQYKTLENKGVLQKDIAEMCGVSQQAVSDSLRRGRNREKSALYFKSVSKIAYPVIARWMAENKYSVSRLEKECGMYFRKSLYNGTLSQRGKQAIISVTKLPEDIVFQGV